MRLLCVMLTVVCVLRFTCTSYGTLITAGGVAQFYDDFDRGTVGSLPDNGAQPGHWSATSASGTLCVSNASVPGPAQGSKYLDVTRTGGQNDEAFAVLASAQSTPGTVIHAEWMQFIPTAAGVQSNIHFEDVDAASTRTAILTGRLAVGGVEYLKPGDGWVTATLTYTPDTWQKWTMDYAVGATTFTFSIDGASQTVPSWTSGAIATMFFTPGGDATFYLDAVPEPSAMALVATGFVGLLAYAWRGRK